VDLEPGTTIDRYLVERVLGHGAMAVVYLVRHQQLDSLHALKVLKVTGAELRHRLLQEGRVQAKLRHPNILSVTDVIDVNGAPGLVLEHIQGPSLEKLLLDHRLNWEQVDDIARGVLRGVGAAHARGLVHRDLKPGNIMLAITDEGLVPKVADFGLAKILCGEGGMAQTRSGVTMGTPAYMAPEQIRDSKHVDHRADLFALGAILYEVACGRRTFGGDDIFEELS